MLHNKGKTVPGGQSVFYTPMIFLPSHPNLSKTMIKYFAGLFCISLLAACAGNGRKDHTSVATIKGHTETKVLQHPDWSRNATIYEVNIRQHTPEGTFAAFEKDLPRLREMGVDILWLMPIHPIGV